MALTIDEKKQSLSAYEQSLDDVRNGRVNTYQSIDEFFAHTYDTPCQMSLAEVKERLNGSEQRFERGEYVSEEEMELFFKTL